MAVVGDALVENCRECYSKHGMGVRLKRDAHGLNCSSCGTRYKIEQGMLERIKA